MNQTPRALNRILLTLLGLALLCTGTLLVLISTSSAAARSWRSSAEQVRAGLEDLFARTRMFDGGQSWLWVLVAVAMLLLIVLLGVWISLQGRGRTGTLVSEYSVDDGAPGRISISGAAAEQSLREALLRDPDIVGASVSSWGIAGGGTALKVRIQPRQGAAPHLVAADATHLIDALDLTLGVQQPVLLSIEAGPRFRLGRDERVR